MRSVITFFVSQLLSVAALSAATTTASQDWEVLALSTYSPSGRPGTSPWYKLNTTIWDPNNNSNQEKANCSAQWVYLEPPYGKWFNCSTVSYGQWKFEMTETDGEYSSPTLDFMLHFVLEKKEGDTFDGAARFVVGQNMGGLCSASGFCMWDLMADLVPWRINYQRRGT